MKITCIESDPDPCKDGEGSGEEEINTYMKIDGAGGQA